MFLNSRSNQKILWKIFYKKLLLRKCHVRFILHVVLAAEGYIRGKVIILHLQSFAIYGTCFVSGINYTGGIQIKTCFLGSSYHLWFGRNTRQGKIAIKHSDRRNIQSEKYLSGKGLVGEEPRRGSVRWGSVHRRNVGPGLSCLFQLRNCPAVNKF